MVAFRISSSDGPLPSDLNFHRGMGLEREYNIFECLPDGSVQWRGTVVGLQNARTKLEEIARDSQNDHFAMHLPTRNIVLRTDLLRKEVVTPKAVCQISYDDNLRQQRANLLRSRGYGVVSVIGNEAAKLLLSTLRANYEFGFFIVGHAAPEQTRKEMIDWLRKNYPGVKIIALNAPQESIPMADYNVIQNGPEAWLRLVARSA
jgi:hypothetical protein